MRHAIRETQENKCSVRRTVGRRPPRRTFYRPGDSERLFHRKSLIGLAGVLLGLTGFLAGCNPQDAHNLQEDTKKLAKDTGEALGTAALAAKVNTHLSLHKGVSMSGLHIDANKEGVVTVSGHVRNKEEHDRVIHIVKETTGVDKWEDKLKVEPSR